MNITLQLVLIFIAAFLFGFGYRYAMRRIARGSVREVGKNIDTQGRVVRLIVGVVLLALAYYLDWNPFILFFAGFCFFQALFSWCGLYALIGKSTCPTE